MERIAIENIKNIEKNARATFFMVSMLSMAKTEMLASTEVCGGGVILFCVNDDGTVVGLDKTEKWAFLPLLLSKRCGKIPSQISNLEKILWKLSGNH